MSAFEVFPYDIERLKAILADKSLSDPEQVAQKVHVQYFAEYLVAQGASTILVEQCYVDHDFLDDFAAYYVKCFREYARFCTRLHFFRNAFAADDFRASLIGSNPGLTVTDLQRG